MSSGPRYEEVRDRLTAEPRAWLVTGAAGFIGSHLVETLLSWGQEVRGLDDLSTGRRSNLEDVERRVGAAAWRRFDWIEGDVCDLATCARACAGAAVVLHQAALGSVPRSVADPLATHRANVGGFLSVLRAADAEGARRVVYASSSSVYGDHPELPKREDAIGEPLSPYAASKRVDEIYAAVFQRTYGLELAGLRYFNVFGPRQDPAGPYAAVIPRWIETLLAGEAPIVNGDGETSRDFCPVANVVQANLLAATAPAEATGRVYNVGLGGRTTLRELFEEVRSGLARLGFDVGAIEAEHGPFREGDVRHSLADVSRAAELLGYRPATDFREGLASTLEWFAGLAAGARRG